MTEVLDASIFDAPQAAGADVMDASIFNQPQQQPAGISLLDQAAEVAWKSVGEPFVGGTQASATGLAVRGKLPDIQLDERHASWYQKLAASAGQMAGDFPAMVAGGIVGGAAGSAAPVVGNAVGAGAGAFALPAAIREAYIKAYQNGEIDSSADFLTRAKIAVKYAGDTDVLAAAGKEALIGGLTVGAGKAAQVGARSLGLGGASTAALTIGAEAGTVTVTPAMLERRLPEWGDFVNGALMIGGLKGMNAVSRRMSNVWAKTGKAPEEVTRDAMLDPQIQDDLGVPPKITPEIKDWQETSKKPLDATGVTTSADLVNSLKTHLGENHFASALVDKLSPSMQGFKVEVLPESEWKFRGYSQTQQARTDFKNGVIQFKGDVKPEAALHEVIHEATATELKTNAAFREAIKSVMDNVRAAISSGDVNEVSKPEFARLRQAMKKEEEFIAYGLSSPEVMNALRGIKGSGTPTAFTDFVQSIAKNYGFGEKDYTALHDLIRAVDTGLDKAPKVEGSVEVAPPDIPRAYEKIAVSDEVDNATRPAAGVKPPEATFPTMAEVKGPKPTFDIDLNGINSEASFDEALNRITAELKSKTDAQKGGRVSWEDTDKQVIDTLQRYGADYYLKSRNPYDAVNHEELRARMIFANKTLADFKERAQQIKDNGVYSEQDMVDMLAATQKVLMAVPDTEGAKSEAGRTLAMCRNNRYSTERAKLIEEFAEKYGNDPEAFINAVLALDDPEQLAQFAKKLNKATTYDKFLEAFRSSLVSGPFSQIQNIAGNVVFMPTRAAVDAASIAFGKMRGAEERVTAAEPAARLVGNLHGVSDGIKLAGKVLLNKEAPTNAEINKNAIGGKLGEAIRLPLKGLAMGDAIVRTMVERGEAYTLAARQAVKEGYDPATREFRDRYIQIATRELTPKMEEEIKAAGLRGTFNMAAGTRGRAVQNAIKAYKLQWAVPFTQTPLNVASEVARLTPLAPASERWIADFNKGGIERDRALAEFTVGAGLGALTFAAASSGLVTGGGDTDPKKRATQLASGWQPYSFKIGDKYYSFARLAPLGTVIGLYADIQQAWEHMTPDEQDKIPKIMVMALSNAITNQTFVQGLMRLLEVVTAGDEKGPKFLEGLAGSLVPGFVSQMNTVIDPYQREVNGMLDAIKARIPGVSETLPPKRDLFGEPVEQKKRLAGSLPVNVSQDKNDPVMQEAVRLGIGVNKAPKSIQMPSMGDKKLGKIELTPQQRDIFGSEAGHLAHQILEQQVTSPLWSVYSDFEKERAFKQAFEIANRYGSSQAVTADQRETKAGEIQSGLEKKMKVK